MFLIAGEVSRDERSVSIGFVYSVFRVLALFVVVPRPSPLGRSFSCVWSFEALFGRASIVADQKSGVVGGGCSGFRACCSC